MFKYIPDSLKKAVMKIDDLINNYVDVDILKYLEIAKCFKLASDCGVVHFG